MGVCLVRLIIQRTRQIVTLTRDGRLQLLVVQGRVYKAEKGAPPPPRGLDIIPAFGTLKTI